MIADYGLQVARACAAYETEKAVRTETFNQDVEFQIGVEKMRVATDPVAWVTYWVANETEELATLYKQIAINYNDEAEIGRIVKRIFTNRLRVAAEHIVEQRA